MKLRSHEDGKKQKSLWRKFLVTPKHIKAHHKSEEDIQGTSQSAMMTKRASYKDMYKCTVSLNPFSICVKFWFLERAPSTVGYSNTVTVLVMSSFIIPLFI